MPNEVTFPRRWRLGQTGQDRTYLALGACDFRPGNQGWRASEIVTVSGEDIDAYDTRAAAGLRRVTSANVPLVGAENAKIVAFRPEDGGTEHLAIVIGEPDTSAPVLIRLHSECFTGDVLGS